jgi:hypothetical protein
MALLSKYNSSSADIPEEIEKAAVNPTVVARQYAHFVQESTGLKMAEPEWCLSPLAPLLDTMSVVGDFGNSYDYMPDKMSFELYGTHELWPILMRLNGALERSDFRGPKLMYVKQDSAGQLLDMLRFGVARAERTDEASMLTIGDLTVRKVVL